MVTPLHPPNLTHRFSVKVDNHSLLPESRDFSETLQPFQEGTAAQRRSRPTDSLHDADLLDVPGRAWSSPDDGVVAGDVSERVCNQARIAHTSTAIFAAGCVAEFQGGDHVERRTTKATGHLALHVRLADVMPATM